MEADWITLALFLLFFIVLPLLQQLGRRKQPPQEEAEEQAEAEWEQDPASRRGRRLEPEEWDAWSEAEAERETLAERSAWEEMGLDDLFREPRPEPRAEPAPLPEPWRETAPPPRPEPAHSPRWESLPPEPREPPRPASPPARVERSPQRVATRPAAVVVRPAPHLELTTERRHPERRQLAPPATVWHARRSQLIGELYDRQGLRRAIILTEVLGPPRSLREHTVPGLVPPPSANSTRG